ncbi:MAG: hypothetical protein HQK51_16975 [Oligoflexia bacterium]|nr:hypothetical protein [Oligoflexia bacterium]
MNNENIKFKKLLISLIISGTVLFLTVVSFSSAWSQTRIKDFYYTTDSSGMGKVILEFSNKLNEVIDLKVDNYLFHINT